MQRNYTSILASAVGPYDEYCSGTSLGSGTGYIAAALISTAAVKMSCSHAGSQLLDETIAFDKAEASGPNITQTNMITVSSFNGLNGLVLGHDLLEVPPVPHRLYGDEQPIPILDLSTLEQATLALFGTVKNKKFPIMPGEHLTCAYKAIKQRGPTIIYGSLALAIAKDRQHIADLFMEDLGTMNEDDDNAQKIILDNLINSIKAISENIGAEYEKIFIGIKTQHIAGDEIGCVITAAPYIKLPKRAIPNGNPNDLQKLSCAAWSKLAL